MALAASGGIAHAQNPGPATPPPDGPTLVLARRVLDASGGVSSMLQVIRAAIPEQRAAMPDVPAVFWDEFSTRVNREASSLVDSLAYIYATLFTRGELEGLLAFYESPIGRRFRDMQPSLMEQSSAAGQRWGERMGLQIVHDLQESGQMPKP